MNKEENILYLAFIAPPLNFGSEPYLVAFDPDKNIFKPNLEYLSNVKTPIVTYSFWVLIEWFREKNLQLPRQIIDLKIVTKLITGRPKSDFPQNRPWSIWELIKGFYKEESEETLDSLKRTLALQLTVPDGNDSRIDLEKLVKVLPEIWGKSKSKLTELGEYQRFINVEFPVYQVFLRRQLQGISVDGERVKEKLKLTDRLFYKNTRRLNVDYGLNYRSLLNDKQKMYELLDKERLAELKYLITQNNIEECLDIASVSSEICQLLHGTLSARREKNVLLKFITTYSGKIFPVFDTMGTVTGRILVVDPHIQYLKKASRDIICADIGKYLLYIDYDHFEPGIMASLSDDIHLTNIYNQGDIYLFLSEFLFGDREHRKLCKKIFLAYSYGMSKEGLELLLQKGTIEPSNLANKFFNEFKSIENWKSKVWQKLLSNGRISTVYGNYRYRSKEGELENNEKRWAISQIVQGTGAYILKKVILQVSTKISEAEILVPMHDAILFQLPEDQNESIINEIKDVFIKTFKEVCPQIQPRVSMQNFYSEQL